MDYKKAIVENFYGINDSSLREGEQYNKAEFSIEDQIRILESLHAIKVDVAEVGNPIVPEIKNDIKVLSKIKKRPLLMSHIRNKNVDLNAVIDTNVEGVYILCTVDPDRLESMNIDLSQHIDDLVANVKRAKKEGLVVRVSVEHGLEEDFFSDALKIFKIVDSIGVDRVQVADTRGVMFPWEVFETIKILRKEIKTDIGVHLHNDLGNSVANAMQALSAGANWIDTSLLGVGERTGISPLSSILISLCKVDSTFLKKYSLNHITEAERLMARILGIQVPHNLITSSTAFSHKAGIHINGIQKQGTEIYEAFDPKDIGNKRIIVSNSRISGKREMKHGAVNNEIEI